MPTVEEKLHAAEEHLTILQSRLASVRDPHTHEHSVHEVTNLEEQIASVMQDIEYHTVAIGHQYGGGAAADGM